jgi:hypothetical protein
LELTLNTTHAEPTATNTAVAKNSAATACNASGDTARVMQRGATTSYLTVRTCRNLRDMISLCHPALMPDLNVVNPESTTMDFLRTLRNTPPNEEVRGTPRTRSSPSPSVEAGAAAARTHDRIQQYHVLQLACWPHATRTALIISVNDHLGVHSALWP